LNNANKTNINSDSTKKSNFFDMDQTKSKGQTALKPAYQKNDNNQKPKQDFFKIK